MTNPYNEALGATLIERSKREKIVLVGVTLAHHTDAETEASLDELALLIDTAGADEAARLMQRRDTPDHTWFIGKGKAEELREICLAVDADCRPLRKAILYGIDARSVEVMRVT